jgi:hypothetical protein
MGACPAVRRRHCRPRRNRSAAVFHERDRRVSVASVRTAMTRDRNARAHAIRCTPPSRAATAPGRNARHRPRDNRAPVRQWENLPPCEIWEIREGVGLSRTVRPQARIRMPRSPHTTDGRQLLEHDHVESIVAQHLCCHQSGNARADDAYPPADRVELVQTPLLPGRSARAPCRFEGQLACLLAWRVDTWEESDVRDHPRRSRRNRRENSRFHDDGPDCRSKGSPVETSSLRFIVRIRWHQDCIGAR